MFALVYTIDGRTERHLLDTGDTTIGRSPGCDLVINDPSVSRRHARLRVHGDHCLLTDLRGRNGTFLNGDLVAESEVRPGDTITLGRFPLVLQLASAAGLALSDHRPPESPSAIVRHVDDTTPGPGSWRLAVDTNRLFGLMSTIARRVVHWHSSRELMEQVVEVVFDTIPAERAFLLTPETTSAIIVPQVARSRGGHTADGRTLSRAVIERVIAERVAILSTDTGPATAAPGTPGGTPPAARWFVAAPLWNYHEILGVLYADSHETFSPADLDLLHALALYAAAAIDQARDTDRLILDARRLREAASQ
jgi:pSer/pThr/pTyr-binding forkhead associated (FHA) protein